uniref:PiggyBac transposable element-derived protein domain-containing protein n=1 Tax=Amphimedon queenslandica TaxID=400682 RepID=A0A1X7UCR2_AMPQE
MDGIEDYAEVREIESNETSQVLVEEMEDDNGGSTQWSWSDLLQPVCFNDFNQEVGPAVTLPSSPLQVFRLFFTSTILQLIVNETNCYALLCLGQEKYQMCDPVNEEDILAYFGNMILMGLIKLPAIANYWRTDPLFHCSIISESMTRDRFFHIHRFIHFVDNISLPPPTDSRRSSLKQYMPMKPVKRGIKVWARADSTNGYISRFQVYTGKETSSETGLGSHVVKDLTSDIHHKNHQVFSVSDLLQKGIYACGTIRSNCRGFPPELAPLLRKGLSQRGDSITVQSQKNHQLTASVWQDIKPVTVSSTFCQTLPLGSVSRKLRNGQHMVFPSPEAITQYNCYMGGVDRNEQLRQYYHVRLKCRKHYKYIFWMLFDITITNSYIISSDVVPCSKIKDYWTILAKALLQGYCSRKGRG